MSHEPRQEGQVPGRGVQVGSSAPFTPGGSVHPESLPALIAAGTWQPLLCLQALCLSLFFPATPLPALITPHLPPFSELPPSPSPQIPTAPGMPVVPVVAVHPLPSAASNPGLPGVMWSHAGGSDPGSQLRVGAMGCAAQACVLFPLTSLCLPPQLVCHLHCFSCPPFSSTPHPRNLSLSLSSTDTVTSTVAALKVRQSLPLFCPC